MHKGGNTSSSELIVKPHEHPWKFREYKRQGGSVLSNKQKAGYFQNNPFFHMMLAECFLFWKAEQHNQRRRDFAPHKCLLFRYEWKTLDRLDCVTNLSFCVLNFFTKLTDGLYNLKMTNHLFWLFSVNTSQNFVFILFNLWLIRNYWARLHFTFCLLIHAK